MSVCAAAVEVAWPVAKTPAGWVAAAVVVVPEPSFKVAVNP